MVDYEIPAISYTNRSDLDVIEEIVNLLKRRTVIDIGTIELEFSEDFTAKFSVPKWNIRVYKRPETKET